MFFEQNLTIEQLPLSDKNCSQMAVDFCAKNGLMFDRNLQYYCGIFGDGNTMLAGGGFDQNVIKCVAVDDRARDMGLTNKLVSHLRSEMQNRGIFDIFVFTKREYQSVFESLAFFFVGESEQSVLLESNPRGIKNYCEHLKKIKTEGTNGAIVMNANPFTLGHRYLAEKAKEQCDRLFVFVVEEDKSFVSFEDRLHLVKQGLSDIDGVEVLSSGKYIISSATFPTYFLKQKQIIDKNCAQLDADIFGRHIAKQLGISKRFVGTEPTDVVTADYNKQLYSVLKNFGVQLVEIPRLAISGQTVSATTVRDCLLRGDTTTIKRFLPQTSYDMLVKKYANKSGDTQIIDD